MLNFSVRTRVNTIEATCERSRVNVKVERGSTFTFTRDLPYNCLNFIYARKIYVRWHGKIMRQWKSTFRPGSNVEISDVPNLMQMNKDNKFSSTALIRHI